MSTSPYVPCKKKVNDRDVQCNSSDFTDQSVMAQSEKSELMDSKEKSSTKQASSEEAGNDEKDDEDEDEEAEDMEGWLYLVHLYNR